MESIDKTLKYYPLVMSYDNTSEHKEYNLPNGFKYQFYQPGDENDWISIHLESGEFTDEEEASTHFHEYYDEFIDELSKRCFFIVDSTTGEKVGTATISLFNDERGYQATVDWVAIKKSYQGRGLAKPLISKLMDVAVQNGHEKILLHTQTHTWLAAKLYLDYGFKPVFEEDMEGWKLLNTIIEHLALSGVGTIPYDDIYSTLYVAIVKKLKEMHGDNITYEIWDKHHMNRISVRVNGKVYKYKFGIVNDELVIEPFSLNKVI